MVITNEDTLTDVTGATAAIVIDLQTYNATGHFAGPTNSLAIHGVTTHLIPPGGFGYDITHRRPSGGWTSASRADRWRVAVSTRFIFPRAMVR